MLYEVITQLHDDRNDGNRHAFEAAYLELETADRNPDPERNIVDGHDHRNNESDQDPRAPGIATVVA